MKYIVVAFFIIGLADYMFGNKLRLGEEFYKGISILPTLLLSMAGIFSISPILGRYIGTLFMPLAQLTGIDVSLFPSIFIAMDMGAHPIAMELAATPEIAGFSGVLVGSLLGATLSFTLPVALGIIRKENHPVFMRGFIFGMVALPFGVFVGGLVQKLPFRTVLSLSGPLLLVSGIVIVLFLINDKIVVYFFRGLQMLLSIFGAIGLCLQAVESITGRTLVEGMQSLEATFLLIGRVALFLGGVYPVAEVIRRLLQKRLSPVSRRLGLEETTLIAILTNMVNAIIVFDDFDNMGDWDKEFIAVLTITMPYMLGGQLAYVVAEAPQMVPAYLVAKGVAGIVGLLVLFLVNRTDRRPKRKEPQMVR